MDPATIINIINMALHALSAVPALEGDIKSAMKMNWNMGVVQDALQGFQVLQRIITDIESELGITPASGQVPLPIAPAPVATPVPAAPVTGAPVVSAGDPGYIPPTA